MHQAVGRLDVEFQTVALWLFLKQPTIAHIRANAARPFASCLLSTPAGFPRHCHSPWRPHPEKGVGLYLPSQRIAPGRRKLFLPRFAVGFSAQGGSPWFFAELAGALAALAGRKGFAWMRAVRLIGGLRRHLDPAYEYTLVERGQHMRGQLGGY